MGDADRVFGAAQAAAGAAAALGPERAAPDPAQRPDAQSFRLAGAPDEDRRRAVGDGAINDLPPAVVSRHGETDGQRHVDDRDQGLDELAQVSLTDVKDLERELKALLEDWRVLLAKHTPQARQILRKLLDGRLAFTPREEEGVRYYEFCGKGVLDPILTGALPAIANKSSDRKRWWPQRDSDPCFSLERAVSWASRRWGRPNNRAAPVTTGTISAGSWLGEEDSNPRYQGQNLASYH